MYMYMYGLIFSHKCYALDMHLSLQDGDTPLMVASRWGHDRCVQLLLDRGAQVNHQDKVSAFLGSAQCLFLSCSLV